LTDVSFLYFLGQSFAFREKGHFHRRPQGGAKPAFAPPWTLGVRTKNL